MAIPQHTRPNQELDVDALQAYLSGQYGSSAGQLHAIDQFRGGYSNHTYKLTLADRSIVLRKPPPGPRAARAHDVAREYRLLNQLRGHYTRVPEVYTLCEDEDRIGSAFYLMECVQGPILRAGYTKTQNLPNLLQMHTASTALVTALTELHAIDATVALPTVGRPEGYTKRQVESWTARFAKAKTPDVNSAENIIDYLQQALPPASIDLSAKAVLHNDYKFDNLVFVDEQYAEVKTILDWEMCTVGNRWMDLGLTLAYWAQPSEVAEMPFLGMNATHYPGALCRRELVNHYCEQVDTDVPDLLFYYVFGNFKIAGIVQQIYARYAAGHSKDPRFAKLNHVVNYLLLRAQRAIASGSIG